MQQKRQGVHPESPHRPQQRGKDCEKQDAAAQGTQAEIQPQLALGPVEGEQKDRPADRHAVEDVQRRRQPGELQAEGPQQVILQPGGHPQQDGLDKGLKRLGKGGAHGASPEQAAEKALPLLAAVLIGDGVDPAVHMELAPRPETACRCGRSSPVTTSVPAAVDMTMPVSSNRSTSSTPEMVSCSRPISSRRWPAWGHGIVVVVIPRPSPVPTYMGPGGRLCVPRHRPISRYRAPASAWRTVSWTSSTSTVTVRWPKRREI